MLNNLRASFDRINSYLDRNIRLDDKMCDVTAAPSMNKSVNSIKLGH